MFKKVGGLFRPEKKEKSKDNRDDQVAHDLRAARRPSSPIIGIDSVYRASSAKDFQQDNSNFRFLSRHANRPNTEAESNSVAQEVDYSGLFEGSEGKVGVIVKKVESSKFNQFYTTRGQTGSIKAHKDQWYSNAREVDAINQRRRERKSQQPPVSAKRLKDQDHKSSVGQVKASGVMPPPPPLPVTSGASQFETTRGLSNASKKNMPLVVSDGRELGASLVQSRSGGVESQSIAGSSEPIPKPPYWSSKDPRCLGQFNVYARSMAESQTRAEKRVPGAKMPPTQRPVETGRSQFETIRRSSESSVAARSQCENVEMPRNVVSSSSLSSLMPPAPPREQQSSSQFASNRQSAKRILGSSTGLPPQKHQKIQLEKFVKEVKDGNVKREEFKVEITNEAAGLLKGWLNVARQSLAINKLGSDKKS